MYIYILYLSAFVLNFIPFDAICFMSLAYFCTYIVLVILRVHFYRVLYIYLSILQQLLSTKCGHFN